MRWLAQSTVDEELRFRVGRDGPRLVAEWPGLGRFTVTRDGEAPTFEAEPDAPARLVEKVRGGVVRALVRHLHGHVSLHAAAVADDAGAIAFLGDSGAGKSTLASALARQGFSLLSDDILFVEGTTALPSELTSYLDDAAAKALRGTPTIAKDPKELRVLVALSYGDSASVRRLRGHEAARALGRALVRFVLDEEAVHEADMRRLADLAKGVTMIELTRPRGFEHLETTMAIVKAAYESAG